MSVPSKPNQPGILIPHFRHRTEEQQSSGWTELWDSNHSDLWDRGKSSPALRELIEEVDLGTLLPSSKGRRLKALVPGCGRGYDVVLLALHGFDAYGLEVSSTAVNTAKEYAGEQLAAPSESHFGTTTDRNHWSDIGEVHFVQGDFFTDSWEDAADKGSGYDLIYDYTFLCALPPGLRRPWAERMQQLLSPSGILVCLEFPLWKSLDAEGPPWSLKGVYWDLLVGNRCGRISDSDVEQGRRGDEATYPEPGLWERKLYFRPKESYPQGKGTDMVSVWKLKQVLSSI